jgi:hypothetical protein
MAGIKCGSWAGRPSGNIDTLAIDSSTSGVASSRCNKANRLLGETCGSFAVVPSKPIAICAYTARVADICRRIRRPDAECGQGKKDEKQGLVHLTLRVGWGRVKMS